MIDFHELYRRYPIVGWPFEGLISVGIGIGEYFHIREEDYEPAYEEKFDWTENFHNGLALVEKNGESFHINSKGKRVD